MVKVGRVTNVKQTQILASEVGVISYTQLFTLADAPAANAEGRRVYPSGMAYPANDATGVGVVYNDIDVTEGDAEGAVLQSGKLEPAKLPVALTAEFLAANPGITLRRYTV